MEAGSHIYVWGILRLRIFNGCWLEWRTHCAITVGVHGVRSQQELRRWSKNLRGTLIHYMLSWRTTLWMIILIMVMLEAAITLRTLMVTTVHPEEDLVHLRFNY